MYEIRLWLESLLSPPALLGFCLSLLVVLVFRTSGSKAARIGTAGVWVLYVALSLPLTADPVFSSLEQWGRRDASCGPPPAGSVIIVLAGGIYRNPGQPTDFSDLKAQSLRRLLAAVELARRTPKSTLLISGGAGKRYREADVMGALALQMGIPASRIVLDRDSRTTDQSAIDTRGMPVNDQGAARYLLTSAYHMPRAYMAFSHRGQKVCAWPVDFQTIHLPLFERLTPQIGALEKMSMALHEYLGMLFYDWMKYQ